MSDIVERLRQAAYDPSCYGQWMFEAADEIERLLTALQRAQSMLADGQPYGHIAAFIQGTIQGRACPALEQK